MQTFKEAIKDLSKQEIFTNFKGDLVSVFGILEKNNITWQLNYKDNENNITTFTPSESKKSEKQKALEEDTNLQTINAEEVKVDIDKALEILNNILKEYNEEITKTIISLHKKDLIFWNFTLLTTSLKVINIRINAINEEIILNKVNSVLEFRKN
ncbi:MAG: hypothetical protein CMH64_01370 [Nanoarchaeota archaeon]|nr:hypothetical protein [Nanoarchaeota archaeon]|tara:strand:- start:307 stop:771 length:465 start_codon:yes stop_codon:yes gene_type:complete